MRLKRGLERESCDFCHRRKIKCNRAARVSQGETTCSQCDLRQIPCNIDDSNDIRIQRRRQTERTDLDTSNTRSSQEPGVAAFKDIPPTSALDSTATSLPPHDTSFAGTPSFLLSDNLFDLSADSILFLDQIFMGDLSSEWNTPLSFAPSHTQTSSEALSPDDHLHQDLWINCGIDSEIFKSGLKLYFTHAALSLPVLLEDAFWEDYEANRCCHALIYAIACRGIPFTNIPNKWQIQQRLATKFKECFFEHQSSGRGTTHLDDIEALALMANFKYENTSSSIPTHMEALFLSHDSLVIMTLQYRLEGEPSSEMPSRAADRRILLFWHVYGLDAFNNLDYKRPSRIPETDIETTPKTLLPKMETHSYLDAILSLAIIARNMLQRLCNTATRRHGVKPADIEALYGQIESWKTSFPSYLQHDFKDEISPAPKADYYIQLQRCVLHLLQVNCYLQIEGFVDAFGICKESKMDAEIAHFKVEYESLRTVRAAIDVCKWMERYDERSDATYALVDLAPNILRDICAGLGVWMSIRGKRLVEDSSVSPFVVKLKGLSAEDAKRQTLEEYVAIGEVFRDSVKRAVSHADTGMTLERIDMFWGPFRDSMDELGAAS